VKKRIGNKKKDYYIAVDIGKRNCVVCITDKDGYIIEETKYENTLQEAERFAHHLDKNMIIKDVMQFVNLQQICG